MHGPIYIKYFGGEIFLKITTWKTEKETYNTINLMGPELFFFFHFSKPVYKNWIIQEPNTLDLWNKLHFEEEKTESIYHV